MSEFKSKPKRKDNGRNPYVFLVAGIVIGGILVAGLVTVFLLFAGNSSQFSDPIMTVNATIPAQATDAPFSVQNVQPTVIANRLQAVAMSNDGQYLAVVSVEDGVSHIYLTELSVTRNLTGNRYDLYQANGYFNNVVFSPDGSKLIATMDTSSALLFDVGSRTLIEEYAQIGGAGFTADSNHLVVVGRNNGIRVLDVSGATPTLISSLDNEEVSYRVGAVAISDTDTLAIGFDNRIELYDINALDVAPQLIEPDNGFVNDLVFHPRDPNYLAVALAGQNVWEGVVQVYDLSNSSRTQFDFGTRVFSLAFSPDGEWLAISGGETGYGEAKLIAFRWGADNPIPPNPTYYQPLEFTGHEHSILDVAFSSEGYLLSASYDGSVRLWDMATPDDAISVYIP
ncbi:MAG: hypothetical protein Phog2KO_29640 [Phototrophicaceae bacterium]